ELARDITQDAYVDAWRAARRNTPPFDAPDDLIGIRRWLFTVVYRHAIKHLRRRRTITWESLDEQSPAEPAMPQLPRFEDAVAEAEALRTALLSVEPIDAACFLLQVLHGFTTVEIAAILDIRADAARKRLSRAKRHLRDAYSAQSPAVAPNEGTPQ
ncbi:MAG TPA: sigma-70 family RNA polymerase sigma factor, partial [Ktedonobacterales bacterium]